MKNTPTTTDKCILLGFRALTTVGVVQGNVEKHLGDFIEPHELPHRYHDDRNYGKHKLHQYRHKVWGDSPTPHKRKLPREANTQLQDDLLVMLHQQIRGGAVNSGDSTTLLQNLEENLDYSDNAAQVRVLKHHYLNEFGHHISVSEVLSDYSESCVVHLVVNNVPRRDGARRAFVELFGLVPHDMSHSLEFEHIAIDHNHAQVVWKANVSSTKTIRGIDSFAFDENNHIEHQSIMAVSIQSDVAEAD
ncbi:MAG: hypothetical protein SGARI_005682 [Bacillariaceae sp.]